MGGYSNRSIQGFFGKNTTKASITRKSAFAAPIKNTVLIKMSWVIAG
jgi:hypothetical protein